MNNNEFYVLKITKFSKILDLETPQGYSRDLLEGKVTSFTIYFLLSWCYF